VSAATDLDAFHTLAFYTLAHPDPAFIHQHAVDAFAAQSADEETRAITLVFALVGLYLLMEKGYSGREVQRAHMRMASRRRNWPRLPLPAARGAMTVHDVIATPAGTERDAAILRWATCVWGAYATLHVQAAAIADETLA
jgi:hypothetical protein